MIISTGRYLLLVIIFCISKLIAGENPYRKEVKQIVIDAKQKIKNQKKYRDYAKKIALKHNKALLNKDFREKVSRDLQNVNIKKGGGKRLKRCPVKGLKNINTDSDVRYPRVIAFASFSMGKVALKELAEDLHKVGGTLMFRGFVNNSIKETANKYKEYGIVGMTDPTMFSTYKVTKVPTFVLLSDDLVEQGKLVIHDKISGNVSLEYALRNFADSGDVLDADQFLAKYRNWAQ